MNYRNSGCGKLMYPNASSQRCGESAFNSFHKETETLLCERCQQIKILQDRISFLEKLVDDAQKLHCTTGETPAKSADIDQRWLSDVIAMLHQVAGDLSEDNRILALAAQSLILAAPRLDEPADGIWHDWHGGDCPVGKGDGVEARFRDGTDSGKTIADELAWHHDGYGSDIIAWRRV